MQQIVIDQPYKFVPPRVSPLWKAMIRLWLPGSLRRKFGLVTIDTVGGEHLREALDAGHGVLVASNHCRLSDPMVLGLGIDRVIGGRPMFIMAGWHLFMQSRIQRFLLPRVGAFSLYREGADRESLHWATNILSECRGPLILFPEGYISHHNDRIAPLMDGVSFIARLAAKRRREAGDQGGVVVLPTFIRYFFDGNLKEAVDPVLADIEQRLSWQEQGHRSLTERIERVGEALLVQREIEHLGAAGAGDPGPRAARLMTHMLETLEEEWKLAGAGRDPMERVKRLRAAILAGMIDGSGLSQDEHHRRWHQLGILYQAQLLSCRPEKFPDHQASAEQILDVVDQFEEDLTDANRPHPPRRAVICHGEPIKAEAGRRRSGSGTPLTERLRASLEQLMEESRAMR